MMKNILKIIGFSFALLALTVACGNHFDAVDGNTSGNVVIRLAGADGRTVMPSAPVFSKYELTLQSGETVLSPDASGIKDGVSLDLTAGTWTITLNGYQTINEKEILAAQGFYELSIVPSQEKYNVVMELNPIAMEDAADNGLFTFDINLPLDIDAAVIILDGEEYDLMESNTGSVELAAGYYDFSIILTKGTQSAGVFEAAHIYSGLESVAVLDLSNIKFADKVYLTGALGGIRIGTITIADEAGAEIKKIELNDDTAVRSKTWLTDLPVDYIGKEISVSLEFNGETVKKEITLTAKGSADVDLNLKPVTAKYTDLSAWYSEYYLRNNGTELVLDFGFDVTANFSSYSGEIRYTSGTEWRDVLTNYETVTATKYKIISQNLSDFEIFDLYLAADHRPLISAVAAAEENFNTASASTDGKDVRAPAEWVSFDAQSAYQTVISAEKAKMNNPALSDEVISSAIASLAAATVDFDGAKKLGRLVVKTDLQEAINDAIAKMVGVNNAIDGSKLFINELWATPAMFNNLNAALAAAEAINNDEEADVQAEIDAATTALNNAIAAFIIKNGVLINTGFDFKVTFNQPQDETITLSATQTISWVKNEYLDINVTEQFDSYAWYVDGVQITGSGSSIRINARDYSPTSHTLTVKVTKNGVPYTKTLYFKVN